MNKIPVLIAGGGPAGMAVAMGLAAKGIGCAIADASITQQKKAGETIPPNAAPLLHKMDIHHLLDDARHMHSFGNRFCWGQEKPVDKNFFGQMHAHGWHVDRLFFEQQLKQHVETAGVSWMAGCRVMQCTMHEDKWELDLQDADNNITQMQCNFLVDATGRACRIARLMGEQRHRQDALTAAWATFPVRKPINPQYTFVEAVADGWWYAAPLRGPGLALAFFTDGDLLQQSMHTSAGLLKAASQTSMIHELSGQVVHGDGVQPVILPVSTSWLHNRFGSHWLAVGDAAFGYDPLSSYGIVSALEGGYYASHAIDGHLRGNADALPAYDHLISQAFDIYMKMRAQQYSAERRWREREFWKRRGR
jgi:2-polyprenyl-6-methoxyphenol hydroxylase-like FAD-dependent oxidoreductase